MARSWQGRSRGGSSYGRGGSRNFGARGGNTSYSSASSSSSAACSGMVSNNFRRLNMKGKRYLRAPNTSAASVRRRQRAHKQERRLQEQSEPGYGMDVDEEVAKENLPITLATVEHSLDPDGVAKLGVSDFDFEDKHAAAAAQPSVAHAVQSDPSLSSGNRRGKKRRPPSRKVPAKKLDTSDSEDADSVPVTQASTAPAVQCDPCLTTQNRQVTAAENLDADELAQLGAFDFEDNYAAPLVQPSTSQAAECGPLLTSENRQDIEDSVSQALREMGYSDFRPGQHDAVMRILAGQSTLVVSATGSGKSFCYQLPALLYWRERQTITLVVSPLVSLMVDQVENLPSVIPGAALHSNMTLEQKKKVWADLRARKLAVLYVSPEALVGRGSVFLYAMMPHVAFACIDESHCLSQWSHNFRPSYLQVCKVLRERFNTDCLLGLTATATASTSMIVGRHIGVSDLEEGVVGKFQLPRNLRLSVSCVENRDQALLELLNSEPLAACQSIIVYCTRRQTTENIAEMLRSMLAAPEEFAAEFPTANGGMKRRRHASDMLHVEAYHAGMAGPQRTRVQRSFISGRLRIVVATVAFGMGLDKPDIRAIVHYDMPSSLESYVQEMGRAGRDGNVAFCHVFLDLKGSDFKELRHHVFANAVERYTVKQLVQKVFPSSCDCLGVVMPTASQSQDDCSGAEEAAEAQPSSSARRCHGHDIELKVGSLVLDLDATEETLATLLAYLHLYEDHINNADRRWWLHLLPNKTVDEEKFFCIRTPGDLSADDRDHAGSLLLAAAGQHLNAHLHRLCALQDALSRSVLPNHVVCKRGLANDNGKVREVMMKKEMLLREAIADYFDDQLTSDSVAAEVDVPSDDVAGVVHQDVRRLLQTHQEVAWTARAITRLFQGISSPQFPSDVWFRNRMIWRRHADLDYRFIYRVAREQILQFR